MGWMDRWAARAQRKSDERAARWLRPKPPPKYRSPRWLVTLGLAFLAICIAGLVIGPIGDEHHIAVLNALGLLMVPIGLVTAIASFVRARRTRRETRQITDDVRQMLHDKD